MENAEYDAMIFFAVAAVAAAAVLLLQYSNLKYKKGCMQRFWSSK